MLPKFCPRNTSVDVVIKCRLCFKLRPSQHSLAGRSPACSPFLSTSRESHPAQCLDQKKLNHQNSMARDDEYYEYGHLIIYKWWGGKESNCEEMTFKFDHLGGKGSC